jgi:hypothetical protein
MIGIRAVLYQFSLIPGEAPLRLALLPDMQSMYGRREFSPLPSGEGLGVRVGLRLMLKPWFYGTLRAPQAGWMVAAVPVTAEESLHSTGHNAGEHPGRRKLPDRATETYCPFRARVKRWCKRPPARAAMPAARQPPLGARPNRDEGGSFGCQPGAARPRRVPGRLHEARGDLRPREMTIQG